MSYIDMLNFRKFLQKANSILREGNLLQYAILISVEPAICKKT
jgi:hypothetical protein